MSHLSDNLTARRKSLGMTVKDVMLAMSRRGFSVGFSTVAGWFNGNRGIRKMEHLVALCEVLRSDLQRITKGDIEIADQPWTCR